MANAVARRISVFGPSEGEVQLFIEPAEAYRPDSGADTHLTMAEARFLRDSLTLALKVHENEGHAAHGRARLDERNAGRVAAPSDAAPTPGLQPERAA